MSVSIERILENMRAKGAASVALRQFEDAWDSDDGENNGGGCENTTTTLLMNSSRALCDSVHADSTVHIDGRVQTRPLLATLADRWQFATTREHIIQFLSTADTSRENKTRFDCFVCCGASTHLYTLYGILQSKLVNERVRFWQIMAYLAKSAHCSIEGLLPDGAPIEKGEAYAKQHLACGGIPKETASAEACVARLDRLLRLLLIVRYGELSATHTSLLIFALLRIALDRHTTTLHPTIAQLIAKVFDEKSNDRVAMVNRFKHLFAELSADSMQLVVASELLSLTGNCYQLLTASVRCWFISTMGDGVLNDDEEKIDAIALVDAFVSIAAHKQTNLPLFWSAIMMLDDAFNAEALQSIDMVTWRRFESALMMTRKLGDTIDDHIMRIRLCSMRTRINIVMSTRDDSRYCSDRTDEESIDAIECI